MRMRSLKYIYLFLAVAMLMQCKPRAKSPQKIAPVASLYMQLGGKTDTLLGKAVCMEELLDKTEERSSRVDGVFNDFMYHFACVDSFQRSRILFPLIYEQTNKTQKIAKDKWQHDSLFLGASTYCLLLYDEQDVALLNDSLLRQVKITHISLQQLRKKSYTFERHPFRWMLMRINEKEGKLSNMNSFQRFYYQFATDSLFQRRHIIQPLEYVTDDPEDEFSIVEGTLNLAQWMTFRPQLPSREIVQITSPSHPIVVSDKRIIVLRSLDDYLFCTLHFRLKNHRWMLYKYEDIIN